MDKTSSKSKSVKKTPAPKAKAALAPLRFTTIVDPPVAFDKDGVKGKIDKIDSGKGRAPAFLRGKNKAGTAIEYPVKSRAAGLSLLGYTIDTPNHAVPLASAAA